MSYENGQDSTSYLPGLGEHLDCVGILFNLLVLDAGSLQVFQGRVLVNTDQQRTVPQRKIQVFYVLEVSQGPIYLDNLS